MWFRPLPGVLLIPPNLLVVADLFRLTPKSDPIRMKIPLPVDPLIGVRAKIIPLRLQQIVGQTFAAIPVIII